MKVTRRTGRVRVKPAAARGARQRVTRAAGRLASTLLAMRGGAHGTTGALQTLPDSTLLGLAATSVGMGAGFYLARAPRLAIAAGVVPALVMGAAIVLRPIKPDAPTHDHVDEPNGGVHT